MPTAPAQPSTRSAEDLVLRRLTDLARAARTIHGQPDQAQHTAAVHALRVASRRLSVLLSSGRSCFDRKAARRLRRLVRDLRAAAGAVRDCDVHDRLLAAILAAGPDPAIDAARLRIAAERAHAVDALHDLLSRRPWRRRRGILRLAPAPAHNAPPLESLTHPTLARLAERVRLAAAADLASLPALHELRLAVKRLRYAAHELAREQTPPAALESLAQAQTHFGEVNDVATLVDRLGRWLAGDASPDPALASLRDRLARLVTFRAGRAAEWWSLHGPGVLSNFPAQAQPTPGHRTPPPPVEPHPASNGEHPAPASQHDLFLSGQRLAVIDIGSNSIRLLVVEVRSASDWTVLAEERAMTRLAHNISSKRLCAESMARSVEAISRFAAHARALGAADVRAYATAAVREAANRDDFISLVHDRAGLRLALVSPRDEGALTHRSASRVFDLTSGTAAVVDIGGGSLEVVQSRRGVITANTSMPLGAVRLTEAFATADAVTPDEFKALRKHIRGQIRRHIRRPEAPPDILVGCGGAFTTLLTLAAADRGVLIDRNSPALASLGPVSRDQLAAILARLASMPLQQRLRVPGLPADRADIIVAGLAVIHRLMKRLGARAVHVHPGGFREGLMLRLIDEHAARLASNGADVSDARRMESVTALARRCEFPRSHTLHVAGLALSLHDHLAGLGLIHPTPDDRLILHAAAILHDVGVMVEYPRHHKHSRTIIRHAPLVGFTDRQVELIALVARYHRRAQPRARHRDFSALADPDQRVVRRLAGILRLADGLDRRHLQTTTAITVEVGRDRITVIAHAPADATEDLIAARKKSPLLARVLGRRVRVAFAGPGATPPSGPVPPPAH